MRVLVTGAGGQVGTVVPAAFAGHEVLAADHAILDVADRERVEQVVAEFGPDVIVNCAAMTDVDGCEREPERAYAANALGVRHLAIAAERIHAYVVHVSTDYVFDGTGSRPYHEWDDVHPISEYARSKLGGEEELVRHSSSWAIVRTAWVYGRRGGDFVSWVLGAFEKGELKGLVDDQTSTPTYAPDLAEMLATFARERRQGLFHVTNGGSCSRREQGLAALELRGLDPSGVAAIKSADLPRPAARPSYSVLENRALRFSGFPEMRPWRDALGEYLSS